MTVLLDCAGLGHQTYWGTQLVERLRCCWSRSSTALAGRLAASRHCSSERQMPLSKRQLMQDSKQHTRCALRVALVGCSRASHLPISPGGRSKLALRVRRMCVVLGSVALRAPPIHLLDRIPWYLVYAIVGVIFHAGLLSLHTLSSWCGLHIEDGAGCSGLLPRKRSAQPRPGAPAVGSGIGHHCRLPAVI